MPKRKVVACLLLLAAGLAAQVGVGGPQAGGVSRADPKDAEVVLVGDIVEGSAIDTGRQVLCTMVVRAEEVLRGGGRVGDDFKLSWEYTPRPNQSPRQTSQVPQEHGLWFLVRGANEAFRPLLMDPMGALLGGAFLPLPRIQAISPPDSSPEARLASVLGSALEAIAVSEGENLNANWQAQASGAMLVRLAEAQLRFQAIARMLEAVDPAASGSVYAVLAASPYPNLRTVGLAGRLRGGGAEAALALERDAAALEPTLEAMELGRSVMSSSGMENPSFALALARTVVGETEITGLETPVAMRLGWVRRPEVLPYLGLMLESPRYTTRDAAMLSICTALRPSEARSPAVEKLWTPQMQRYCPSGSPIPDPVREQELVAYWKSWWAAQKAQFEVDPSFPRPQAPARYAAALPPRENLDVPMTSRFRALLGVLASWRRTRQEPESASPDRPPQRKTLLGNRLSPQDDERLDQIAAGVSAKLDANQQELQQVLNTFRLKAQTPDQGSIMVLAEESERILAAGLEDVQRELSSAGWAEVDKYLLEMNIIRSRLSAPTGRETPR